MDSDIYCGSEPWNLFKTDTCIIHNETWLPTYFFSIFEIVVFRVNQILASAGFTNWTFE